MCFHSKEDKSAYEVEKHFNAVFDNPQKFKPMNHINGFDYPEVPVIIDEAPTIITHYNWGLIPYWAKDDEIKKFTLNARIETVKGKPSFRESVDKRCLVISNGYYEWQWLDDKGKSKQMYELCLENEEIFAFAGLYSHWVDKRTGKLINTFTILTTEANELLSEIHNHKQRMPVVLKPEDESRWLEHAPIEEFAYPYDVNLIAKKMSGYSE